MSEIESQRSADQPPSALALRRSGAAGRTLAAIPKSIIQTSPGLTPRIFVPHAIKH